MTAYKADRMPIKEQTLGCSVDKSATYMDLHIKILKEAQFQFVSAIKLDSTV